MKFYVCPICGNVIVPLDGNINLVKCCGVDMNELIPNITDASLEKHVPVYEVAYNKINVRVGDIMHPMEEEHYISFIALVNGNNVNVVKLEKLSKPEVSFDYIPGTKIYAYCNIHGLWSKNVE